MHELRQRHCLIGGPSPAKTQKWGSSSSLHSTITILFVSRYALSSVASFLTCVNTVPTKRGCSPLLSAAVPRAFFHTKCVTKSMADEELDHDNDSRTDSRSAGHVSDFGNKRPVRRLPRQPARIAAFCRKTRPRMHRQQRRLVSQHRTHHARYSGRSRHPDGARVPATYHSERLRSFHPCVPDPRYRLRSRNRLRRRRWILYN